MQIARPDHLVLTCADLDATARWYQSVLGGPTAGSADLCLVAVGSLTGTVEHLHAIDCPIEEGPVRRTGALGPMTSVYVRDPDADLVEIAHYEGI